MIALAACGSSTASQFTSTSTQPPSTSASAAAGTSASAPATLGRTSTTSAVTSSPPTEPATARSPAAAFVRTDQELLTVAPAGGVVQRTALPLVAGGDASRSLLALKGGVIVVDGSDDDGRFVPDGDAARILQTSVRGNRGVWPSAEPTHFWAAFSDQPSGLSDVRHLDLTGKPSGTIIDSMGERLSVWGFDGEGWPATVDDGSVWSTRPNGRHGVAKGNPLATGNGRYLMASCSGSTCLATVVNHTDRGTRTVPAELPDSHAAAGAIAPDGSFAIVGFGNAPDAEAWLVDLTTGATTDLGPLGAGPNVIAWSTDSHYGYLVTATHELLVLDRDVGYAARSVDLGGASVLAVATPPVVP